jgi:hypothetical protein
VHGLSLLLEPKVLGLDFLSLTGEGGCLMLQFLVWIAGRGQATDSIKFVSTAAANSVLNVAWFA